jgi:hypothetical protein
LKKTFVFILLILFLFNTVGYFFIIEIHRLRVKKELASRTTGKNDITILRIENIMNDTSFRRIDEKEIRYMGSFYDVVKEVQSGNSLVIYCIRDTKEENLDVAMKTVSNNKLLASLWELVIKNVIPDGKIIVPAPSFELLTYPDFSETLNSAGLTILSPPPKQAAMA